MLQLKGSQSIINEMSDEDNDKDENDDDVNGNEVQRSELCCVCQSIPQLRQEMASKKAMSLVMIDTKNFACCKFYICY